MVDRLKVFVSYRRSDSQHVAGRLGDRLSERYEVFMDIDAIPPGVDFTDYVHRAVEQCDVLVAIIGDRWIDATDDDGRRRIDDPEDWVAEEIGAALRRGVRLIPVLIDNAALPGPAQLPEALRPLASRQALPLRHGSFSADFSRLVAGIEHARVAPPAADPTASPPPADDFADRWETRAPAAPPTVTVQLPAARRRRPALLALSVLVAILIVVGSFAVVRYFGPTGSAAGPNTTIPSAGAPSNRPPFTPVTDLQTLRAHIPATLADTCRRLEPTDPVLRADLLIAVQCDPTKGGISGRNPTYSFYFAYASQAAATTAFRGYYAPTSLPDGDCRTQDGERSYQRRDVSGTLRCYTDSEGFRVFAWTADEFGIVASAADRVMTQAQLSDWWGLAGPIG